MAGPVSRTTPSTNKKRANVKRSRRQLKQKRAAQRPSWTEALKRRYIEADQRSHGKRVDDRPWAKRQAEARRARELAQVRRRGSTAAAASDDDVAESEAASDEELPFDDADPAEGVEVQEDVDVDKMERLNTANPLARQVFLRGLPPDANESDLKAFASRFGEVAKVYVVRNKLTGIPSGSAFVHFVNEEARQSIIDQGKINALEAAAGIRQDRAAAVDGLSRHKAKELLHKLKHQQTTDREPFVQFGQTRVTVHEPMDRVEAQEFVGAMHKGGKKAKRTPTGADDPRNLYLLREGLVEAGTPAAKGLPAAHLRMLAKDYEDRKRQVKNVNFFVSKTRLSIRNLPRDLDSDGVRALFAKHAKDFFKKNPTMIDKTTWGKYGPIKQCRVLVDAKGQSKRFGFVELARHEAALYCLRMINNNPEVFGPNSRPVVTFAVENANAVQKLQRLREMRRLREESGQGNTYGAAAHQYRSKMIERQDARASGRGGRSHPGKRYNNKRV